MKKSKRFFAAMMAAAMTAGMLTGCGGGAKKESAAPAESAQGGSTEAAKEGEQVNLRFVSWQTANKLSLIHISIGWPAPAILPPGWEPVCLQAFPICI